MNSRMCKQLPLPKKKDIKHLKFPLLTNIYTRLKSTVK